MAEGSRIDLSALVGAVIRVRFALPAGNPGGEPEAVDFEPVKAASGPQNVSPVSTQPQAATLRDDIVRHQASNQEVWTWLGDRLPIPKVVQVSELVIRDSNGEVLRVGGGETTITEPDGTVSTTKVTDCIQTVDGLSWSGGDAGHQSAGHADGLQHVSKSAQGRAAPARLMRSA